MLEEKRKKLTGNGYADVILFEMQSYDKSLVGVTADRRAVYDYDMMVEEYMADNGCDAEDATEWIDYNTRCYNRRRFASDSAIPQRGR